MLKAYQGQSPGARLSANWETPLPIADADSAVVRRLEGRTVRSSMLTLASYPSERECGPYWANRSIYVAPLSDKTTSPPVGREVREMIENDQAVQLLADTLEGLGAPLGLPEDWIILTDDDDLRFMRRPAAKKLLAQAKRETARRWLYARFDPSEMELLQTRPLGRSST